MCSGAMRVAEIRAKKPPEMCAADNNHVVQALPAYGSDQSLHVRSADDFGDAYAGHAAPERIAVDHVPVSHEPSRRGVIREGINNLLRGAAGGRMVGNREVDAIRRRWCARSTKTKSARPVTVGTVKKSIDTRAATWLARNVRHVWGGRGRRRRRKRETVCSEMSMQSCAISPWIRGAPQSGFAALICSRSVRRAASVVGRPGRDCRERAVQRRRSHNAIGLPNEGQGIITPE